MINKLYLVLCGLMIALVLAKVITTLGQPVSTNAEGLRASPLAPLGSGFLYQGRLTDGGNPANGLYDFTFKLFDAASGGSQVSSTLTRTNQTVNNGLFTINLDFGSTAFLGDARWLEMAVRLANTGSFTTVTPRQPLLPVPYALNSPWFGTGNKPYPYNPLRQVSATAVIPDNRSFGLVTSITIGSDGLPIFAYYDANPGMVGLRMVHCEDLDCASLSNSLVFAGSGAFLPTVMDMTMGRDGLAIVAWFDPNSLETSVAHCNDVPCTNSTVTNIDTVGGPAITIGSDGLPLIAYGGAGILKAVHCSNVSCTTFGAPSTLDSTGESPSITIGGDGLGLISYENTNGQLKVAHCTTATCTSATVSLLDNTIGGAGTTSIATGFDGLGLVSYDPDGFGNSDHLKALHCSNAACTAGTISTLDTVADVGRNSSIIINPDGLGIISYMDNNFHHVKLASCNNVACTSATVITLDDTTNASGSTSINWGVDGLPVMTYQLSFNTPYRTVFLHCGSPTCVNYSHAR